MPAALTYGCRPSSTGSVAHCQPSACVQRADPCNLFHSLYLQEDRQWALRRGLEEINREIEQANRMGVACWFPMGLRDERIVRLAAREASLLNSRCAGPWKCSPDDGCRHGSLQSAPSA